MAESDPSREAFKVETSQSITTRFQSTGTCCQFGLQNPALVGSPGGSSNRGLKISPLISKGQTDLKMAWSF
jgi:hypothetical protein